MSLPLAVAGALLLTGLAALGSATVSLAADPIGPPIGSGRKYVASIDPVVGVPDVDDYGGALVAGESLSVTVTAARKSGLQPTLQLVDPAGTPRDVEIKSKRGGRILQIKKFVVDRTGTWTVRVADKATGQGNYTISFKIKKAKPLKLKKQTLDAGNLSRDHLFGGIERALLDLKLKGSKKGAAVRLEALLDPSGSDVPSAGPAKASDDVTVKKTTSRLKKLPLGSGDGDYTARVATDGPDAVYDLGIKVTPQGRPRGGKPVRLSPDEPSLRIGLGTVRVIPGFLVRLDGANFQGTPRVLIDGRFATDVAVGGGGTFVQAVVPDGPQGQFVDVTVVNPDDQVSSAPGLLFYAPPPVPERVLGLNGAPIVGGPPGGAYSVLIAGTGLAVEQTATFDGAPATSTASPNEGRLEVVVPAGAAGVIDVVVTDEFGRASPPIPFEFKRAPVLATTGSVVPRGADPFTPILVEIHGSRFQADDVLLFDGVPVVSNFVSENLRTVDLPGLDTGDYSLALRDRVGTVSQAPNFVVKGPPTLSGVSVVAGPSFAGNTVPLAGGSTIRATGARLHVEDTVTLGGTAVTVSSVTTGAMVFDAPQGGSGPADLVVRDVLGRSATLPDALRYEGYDEVTDTLSPGRSTVDDLSALRGALGDLDGDGSGDDLVIVSYNSVYNNFTRGLRTVTGGTRSNAPGSRNERTRIFFSGAAGALQDVTSTKFPARSATDEWNGTAVAVGDLDGAPGDEIVVAGISPDYKTKHDVRVFADNGSGVFTEDTTNSPAPQYLPPLTVYPVSATGTIYYAYPVSAIYPQYVQGVPTAVALGDLDNDDDLDVVVGTDWYSQAYVFLNVNYTDLTSYPYTIAAAYVVTPASYPNLYVQNWYYYGATRILDNDIDNGNGLVDDTLNRMPIVGFSGTAPAFHARDLALGDIDGDTFLDLVVAWDDPGTVTPYGAFYGTDVDREATRVLINDGAGGFRDRTSTWLPVGSSPEFWQAHQVALVDLDDDGDPDMVLTHRDGIDAFLGAPTHTRSALRVLRNDRPTADTFTDVTAQAVPSLPTDSNEDYRGDSLVVDDVNADGLPDILVGTTQILSSDTQVRRRSTRLLLGTAAFRFVLANEFLPSVTSQSGEAVDLVLGDLAGSADPTLFLLTETPVANSPSAEQLRALRWVR